ncbi:MAG: hypothetical protein EBY63_06325, partial [Flavobacteriia bacterium]|nr:hypothetical protein [Flavobacteriia bacterium]
MVAEKFNDIDEFFIRWLISDGENVLEMFVTRPNLMTPEVDSVMEPMGTRHALQVDPVEFGPPTQGEIVP